MQITRWHNVRTLKNHLAQSSFGRFHSTPASFEKNDKWNFDFKSDHRPSNSKGSKNGPKPSKNQIKLASRQRRADSKRALKGLLYNYGNTKIFEDDKKVWRLKGPSNYEPESEDDSNSSDKKEKGSPRRPGKGYYNKLRRKLRNEHMAEDFHDQHVFEATFGNKTYSWSFKAWEEDYENSRNPTGFEWRKDSHSWNHNKKKERDTFSDNEFWNERYDVGSLSDRVALGLPVRGVLKIEEVKTAFRTSALKWHPDKHQGPEKEVAAEKFKVCVNAYKSICTALSASSETTVQETRLEWLLYSLRLSPGNV